MSRAIWFSKFAYLLIDYLDTVPSVQIEIILSLKIPSLCHVMPEVNKLPIVKEIENF